MATWQPQRSKQNCLAAQPEPPLKGFSVYPGPPPGGLAGALAHAPSSRGGPGLGPTDGFRSPNQHPNLKKPEWTWAEEGQEVAGGCMEAAPPTGLERKRRGWGQEVERGTHSQGGTGAEGLASSPPAPSGGLARGRAPRRTERRPQPVRAVAEGHADRCPLGRPTDEDMGRKKGARRRSRTPERSSSRHGGPGLRSLSKTWHSQVHLGHKVVLGGAQRLKKKKKSSDEQSTRKDRCPGTLGDTRPPCATAHSAGDTGRAPWAPRTLFFVFYLFNLLEGTLVNNVRISAAQHYDPASPCTLHCALTASSLSLPATACVTPFLHLPSPRPPSPLVTSILLSVSMRLL